MPWINQFVNGMFGRPALPDVPDAIEEHQTKMPGSSLGSPDKTKSKRPLSPARPDLQPSPKRQKTQHPECNDGDGESDASGFEDAPEHQPVSAQPKVVIERQRKGGFVVGGDMKSPEPASGGGTSVPIICHNGMEARRLGGIFVPPPRPIVWPMAPKDMKIEDMPGFRGYVMRNGRKYPDFDEDTWEKGFSRTLRKHLSNRFKREVF